MAGSGSALRKFGLAAILSFVDKASPAMTRVGARAADLRARFAGLGKTVRQMSGHLQRIALASIPVAAAFTLMVKDGANFEAAFQRVRAVSLDVTGKTTAEMRTLAKVLGATTVFSATQAANAMEELARAGFSTKDVMAATPGVLAAAAAEGIKLADAAEIVAANVRMFKIPAKEAGEVAGTLALVSARTATSMKDLQEGLKYGGPAAAQFTYSLKETALALGVLSNIGIKGSLAGTALRAGLTRLAKPTKEVLSVFGGREGINQVLKDSTGKVRPLNEAMLLMADRIRKIPDPIKRVETAAKIFGVRATALGQAFNLTDEEMKEFRNTQKELAGSTANVAKVMADLQLNSLKGQAEILRSALEGVNIELFELAAPALRGGVKGLSGVMGDLALALMVVKGADISKMPKELQAQVKTLSPAMLNVARGLKSAFDGIREIIEAVGRGFGRLAEWFRALPPSTQRTLAKVGIAAAALVAVTGPLVAGFGLFVTLAKSGVGVFLGLGKTILGLGVALLRLPFLLGGPIGAVLLLTSLFVDFRSVFAGVWQGIQESGAWQALKMSLMGLKNELGLLFKEMFNVQSTSEAWKEFGKTVGGALGDLLKVIGFLVEKMRELVELVRYFKSGDVSTTLEQTLGGKGFAAPVSTHLGAVSAAEKGGGFTGRSESYVASEKLRAVLADVGPEFAKVSKTQEEANTRIKAFVGSLGLTPGEATKAYNMSRLTGPTKDLGALTSDSAKLNPMHTAEIATKDLFFAMMQKVAAHAASKTGGSVSERAPRVARDAMVLTSGYLGVSAGDVVLSRKELAHALTTQTRGGFVPDVISSATPRGGGGSGSSQAITLVNQIHLDGRVIAEVVGQHQLDEMTRNGANLSPQQRTRLRRGFLPGVD